MSHKQVYMAANKLLESLNDLYLIYNIIQILNCCEKIQFSIKISICNALKQGGCLILKCFPESVKLIFESLFLLNIRKKCYNIIAI